MMWIIKRLAMNHHLDTLHFLALERIAELRRQAKHDGLLNHGWTISKLWKRIRPGDPQPKPPEATDQTRPAGMLARGR
jgi:hypothetical protein